MHIGRSKLAMKAIERPSEADLARFSAWPPAIRPIDAQESLLWSHDPAVRGLCGSRRCVRL